MPPEEKTIESLISMARLDDAQKRFKNFLEQCEDEKEALLQSQARLAYLLEKENQGTLSREDGNERNQITVSFIRDISEFKNTLSQYFDVGNSKQLFDKIKSRNEIISKALEARVIDKQYIVSEQMKDGNSSIIYRLSKINTEQEAVALVLKSPELSDGTREEFIKLTRLRHRNIIKLLDYELNSFPFFVISEFVHGDNLLKILDKTGERPLAQLVDWLYQLADALDYMRHKNILHTNVRPSKIFIDEELNVMLSPFDFNHTNKDDRTFSRYQDVCLYGSPELVKGDGELLSLEEMCRSDQYSLGLIAYKVLTGKELFEGATIVEILKNRNLFSTNKTYRAAKLSIFPTNPLGQIIRKLLNEDPAKRFNNLHEVAKALNTHIYNRTKITVSNTIRDSYRRCLANNRMLISDFYDSLFVKMPEIRTHFQSPKKQLSILQMAIDLLLDIDTKKPLLLALLTNDKHKNYTLSQFDMFIDTFLDVIKKNDAYWDSVKNEWLVLKDKISSIIKEAGES